MHSTYFFLLDQLKKVRESSTILLLLKNPVSGSRLYFLGMAFERVIIFLLQHMWAKMYLFLAPLDWKCDISDVKCEVRELLVIGFVAIDIKCTILEDQQGNIWGEQRKSIWICVNCLVEHFTALFQNYCLSLSYILYLISHVTIVTTLVDMVICKKKGTWFLNKIIYFYFCV